MNEAIPVHSNTRSKAIKFGALLAVSFCLGALAHPIGIDKAVTGIFVAPLATVGFVSEGLGLLALPMLFVYGVARLFRRKPSFWSLLAQSTLLAALFGLGSS